MAVHEPLRVLVPLASGFEELELAAIVDVLRRAELDVVVAGLPAGRAAIVGSHGIAVVPDVALDEVDLDAIGALVLPGGPGTEALAADERLLALIRRLDAAGKPVAAVCAAPLVLAKAGVLEGREATSHPSARGRLAGAKVLDRPEVVTSRRVVTSQGAGTSIEFALTLVEQWVSKQVADTIAERIVHRRPRP